MWCFKVTSFNDAFLKSFPQKILKVNLNAKVAFLLKGIPLIIIVFLKQHYTNAHIYVIQMIIDVW
jgi:hypothetical protein